MSVIVYWWFRKTKLHRLTIRSWYTFTFGFTWDTNEMMTVKIKRVYSKLQATSQSHVRCWECTWGTQSFMYFRKHCVALGDFLGSPTGNIDLSPSLVLYANRFQSIFFSFQLNNSTKKILHHTEYQRMNKCIYGWCLLSDWCLYLHQQSNYLIKINESWFWFVLCLRTVLWVVDWSGKKNIQRNYEVAHS